MNLNFIASEIKVSNWESLAPFFTDLYNRPIHNLNELLIWLTDRSNLESAISEDACWRQINVTRNTLDTNYQNDFNYFCAQIQPNVEKWIYLLNQKFISHNSIVEQLDKNIFSTYIRKIKKNIDLFNEENIAIQVEINMLQQQYALITSKMNIEYKNQHYTLQQASQFFENKDREVRKEVYFLIQKRREKDKDELNNLYSTLILKRHQIALNAGFTNYRDYKFVELNRFDYSVNDCTNFHIAVKEIVLPLINKIYKYKKQKLNLENYTPYDLDIDVFGLDPLKPCKNTDELINKTIDCFTKIDPFFGNCIKTIKEKNQFDLDSRNGKSPGGYNCPLAVTGIPFIFMNANLQFSDVITMLHEGGHAIHSFLCNTLPLQGLKEYNMEIAEIASMSMELIALENGQIFFNDTKSLNRAKLQVLERAITILPWIALIDAFQHWVYENPTHSIQEREQQWVFLQKQYSSEILDFTGVEDFIKISWQKQLHLYEVPFYYIEYGIAQLGAIAMWKNYVENPIQTINNYKAALSLGASKSLPILYKTAGIEFNFSADYIKPIIHFVEKEMEKLQ